MALQLDSLLAPIEGDDPAGPDLAYDDERYTLEQVFDRPVSIDASGEETEAAEVDWRQTIRLIENQSGKTKDIWLPVYLCRAGASSGQLEVVETGAQYLAGLVETFWPEMHPKLDEYGFQGRKGPCDSLVATGPFLNPLRRTVLLTHPRLGSFTGVDFERFRQNGASEEGYGLFRAALEAIGEDGLLESMARLDRIENGLRRADTVLTTQAEDTTSTNFKPAYDVLGELKRAVAAFTTTMPAAVPEPGAEGDAAGASGSPASGSPAGGAPAASKVPGRIDSRTDVLAAMEAIADYYRRMEPSSPVPLALQRARDWVNLDFMAVLEDIAPESLAEAKRVLMARPKDPTSEY